MNDTYIGPNSGLAAVTARDIMLTRVQQRNQTFHDEALLFIKALAVTDLAVTGEDIRLLCTKHGLVPRHHNAWGALITAAMKAGYLLGTKEYVRASCPQSHARRARVYHTAALGLAA